MMLILHGIFTSAFSLVYCDKFRYEKPSLDPKSPEPQLCRLFWFLVMYMHTVLAQCPTLVGWQVCNNLFQTCGNKYLVCVSKFHKCIKMK